MASDTVSLTVLDQVVGARTQITLDLAFPPKFEVLLATIAAAARRPVRRLFNPDGVEFTSTDALVVDMAAARTKGQDIFQVVVTDGLNFSFKYGDHSKYRFGDHFLRPLGRALATPLVGFTRLRSDTDEAAKVLEPPQPPPLPLSGNLKDLGLDAWQSFFKLEARFGPLVKLRIFNDVIYVCADPDVIDQVGQVPDKRIPTSTFGMKTMACQGVFIADGQQWRFARDELQKSLTPEVLDELIPVFAEKALELESQGRGRGLLGEAVDVLDWIERLTYDVICTVGFGYNPRMLERKQGEKEPFIEVFDELLAMSINAALYGALDVLGTKRKEFSTKTEFLNKYLDSVIDGARRKPGKSFLHQLMNARCPLTGRSFDESELRDQLITLLVAGHKTTTLLMTWVLWHLASHGEVEEALAEELREVFGDDMHRVPTGQDLRRLSYLDKVVKETLRLASPVQVAQRGLTQPVKCGKYVLQPGGYKGRGNSWVAIHVMAISHSKQHWGEDVLDFRPERFNPDAMKGWHPYQYIPFGCGRRLCIGNLFAITQVKVAIVMLMRKYHFRTVTGKDIRTDPKDLVTPLPASRGGGVWLRFHERRHWDEVAPPHTPAPSAGAFISQHLPGKARPAGEEVPLRLDARGKELLILWGGEYNTTKRAAELLRGAAERCNFKAVSAACDEFEAQDLASIAARRISLVVLMATYNGHPPANAAKFVEGLVAAAEAGRRLLQGASYAVMAVGNSNWVSTFVKVGRVVDDALARCGGERLLTMEVADKNSSYEQDLVAWRRMLFLTLGASASGIDTDALGHHEEPTHYEAPGAYLSLDGDTSMPGSEEAKNAWGSELRLGLKTFGYSFVHIKRNEELCGPAPPSDPHRSVRFVELALTPEEEHHPDGPAALDYECGDHLEVWPQIPKETVHRLCQRLGVHPQAVVVPWSSRSEENQDSRGSWAIGHQVVVEDMVSWYCDVTSVPSREALAAFAEAASQPAEREAILALVRVDAPEAYEAWKCGNRNFLDSLEDWPSVRLSLARFVEVAPRIEPRVYSIASSPVARPSSLELCCGVVRYETPQGRLRNGLCSSMLAGIQPGEQLVACKVKRAPYMKLPADPTTPVACICGGTGIAPFLGFLQQRAADRAAGRSIGEATLYFGCRGDYDCLHLEQLRQWEAAGICRLSISYSRKEGVEKEYVYHAMRRDAAQLRTLLAEPGTGRLYLCGSASTLAKDCLRTLATLLRDGDEAAGQEAITRLEDEHRIVLDVWG